MNIDQKSRYSQFQKQGFMVSLLLPQCYPNHDSVLFALWKINAPEQSKRIEKHLNLPVVHTIKSPCWQWWQELSSVPLPICICVLWFKPLFDEGHNWKGYPTDTRRNNNLIMTSKRRFDVIMTLLLRRVSVGYHMSSFWWNFRHWLHRKL